MTDFITALNDPHIPFLRYAFLAGIFSSIAFGVIGTYVVARRITYIAGAIAHCVLGGIGAGLYLQSKTGLAWLSPLNGAIVSAILAAVIIGLVSIHAKQREDTTIGALWSVGMAAGLLLIAKTPGYVEPMSYLFGNILLLTKTDLWIILALDAVVVCLATLFYNKFLAVCFDEEFARLRGIRTEIYYLLLLCLTALTVVLMVRVVGIVMVIALLTLPAAVAGNLSKSLRQMMVYATFFCVLFVSVGLGFSYTYDLPSGPTIIIVAGVVYIMGLVAGKHLRWRQ